MGRRPTLDASGARGRRTDGPARSGLARAVLVTLALGACEGDAAARAEAERVVAAVRALREAPSEDKPARLAALRGVDCTQPDLRELKGECVSAYELYTKGLDAVRAVKRALASDAGETEARRAAELLADAERDVEAGKQRASRCAELEGRVVTRHRLR